jgi:hypothetical protein
LLALVTVQFFEELGWAGLVQHRLQARHGALKASLLVALAFAFLHLPTYLRSPISGQSAIRDLSVLAIVIPFAVVFRILIAFAYNRTAYAVLIAAIIHASFNEASELIAPNVPGPLAQVLAFASTGLLALLAVVLSKGALDYHREHRKAGTRRRSAGYFPDQQRKICGAEPNSYPRAWATVRPQLFGERLEAGVVVAALARSWMQFVCARLWVAS